MRYVSIMYVYFKNKNFQLYLMCLLEQNLAERQYYQAVNFLTCLLILLVCLIKNFTNMLS